MRSAPQCFLRGSGKPGSTALLLLAGEVLQGREHLLDSDRQLGIAGCGIIDMDSSRGNPLASKTSKVQAGNYDPPKKIRSHMPRVITPTRARSQSHRN
jgi:hypothetical protein